jgi:hypothetical protein
MDNERKLPPLKLSEATCLPALPASHSSRGVNAQDSNDWLLNWRQACKCVSDAHNARRNHLLDTSAKMHQSISNHAEALSNRTFEGDKSTLDEWDNLQLQVKTFAYPSPPTSSRLLRANDQLALNAILSPRYRRQLAHELSDNRDVRNVFSLSKSLTSSAIGCHVNASILNSKSVTAMAVMEATTSRHDRFFLTETEMITQRAPDVENFCNKKSKKGKCFKEPSQAQMSLIRSLSQSLSQKMKLLIDLTGMLASQILDDQRRRQLRNELESAKVVCKDLRQKLERVGIAKPQLQLDFSSLAADNADLIRRIENLHPLQLLLARTVTSLDSEDEALLKRTQSQLQSCVVNVNSMSRKSIKQLAAANELAHKNKKKRQIFWIESTFVILSVYRLLAMRPNSNSAHRARNAASSVIAKFLRQKTLSKTLTRQARAVRVLIKATRYFVHWVLRMRKKKESAKIIKQFLIELRDVHPAAKTIKKFRKRVISIQKMIRHFLMRRNFLYMRLLGQWIRIEEKQRKKHNGALHAIARAHKFKLTCFVAASVQFKYEEKPSIQDHVRIGRLRNVIQAKQRNWILEFRAYLRADQVYRDELEVSRMLRMQMECFMQGRALPDSVLRGLPKDTRRIYKKLNSHPPKPPPQHFQISDVEMKRLVHAELFKDCNPLTEGTKMPERKKKAVFVNETGSASEHSEEKLKKP